MHEISPALLKAWLDAVPVPTLLVGRPELGAALVLIANRPGRPIARAMGNAITHPVIVDAVDRAHVAEEPLVLHRVVLPPFSGRVFSTRATAVAPDRVALAFEDVTAEIHRRDTLAIWGDVIDDLQDALWICSIKDRSERALDLQVLSVSVAARRLGHKDRRSPATLGAYIEPVIPRDDLERLDQLVRAEGEVDWHFERDGRSWRAAARSLGHRFSLCLQDLSTQWAITRTLREHSRMLADARSDLTVVSRAARLLARQSAPPADASALLAALDSDELAGPSQLARRMVAASARASGALRDLAELAEIGSSAGTHETVQLDRVVDRVIADLRPRLAETGARIQREWLPPIWGHSQRWSVVFEHLFDNALRFARPNVPLEVVVQARQLRSGSHITIQDNGCGIPEEFVDIVFEPLFRYPATPDGGLGLGLTICKRTIENHFGSIRLDSVPGQGTTVSIELPSRL